MGHPDCVPYLLTRGAAVDCLEDRLVFPAEALLPGLQTPVPGVNQLG